MQVSLDDHDALSLVSMADLTIIPSLNACSQSNNRLDGATGNFVTDCDHQTYCTDAGICSNKTCRQDEVSRSGSPL